MLTPLEQIVNRLVEVYDPERVILFGSAACGRTDASSDVDLLIVEDTTARPIERRTEMERLLADRAVS